MINFITFSFSCSSYKENLSGKCDFAFRFIVFVKDTTLYIQVNRVLYSKVILFII